MPAKTPEQLHSMFAEAYNAGDLERLVDLYDKDAVLVPSPGTEARGIDAIRAALGGFLGVKGTMTLDTRWSLVEGDTALLSGAWTLTGATGPDGKPTDIAGKTTEVARRGADGGWRYYIDNPNGAD
jgi:uncharacterized protein (TIGR02246 family)